jgi:hypothetical protein
LSRVPARERFWRRLNHAIVAARRGADDYIRAAGPTDARDRARFRTATKRVATYRTKLAAAIA